MIPQKGHADLACCAFAGKEKAVDKEEGSILVISGIETGDYCIEPSGIQKYRHRYQFRQERLPALKVLICTKRLCLRQIDGIMTTRAMKLRGTYWFPHQLVKITTLSGYLPRANPTGSRGARGGLLPNIHQMDGLLLVAKTGFCLINLLALNCAAEFQFIRANTCSRAAKNCCHPLLAPW